MTIPTRTLGHDGPRVGAIGLGCMGMSWAYNHDESVDDAKSVEVIHRALDLGVTLIDTSDAYGPFTNEELVGRALRGRDDYVLATKGGLVADLGGERPTIARNGHPDHLREALDASLRRLGVDHIDLYQLHRTDPDVPVEESWGVFAEAVAAGKVRHAGMSEATIDELERANAIHPVTSLQSELSLWTRDALDDVLPWCVEHGVAFIPFSPLGRGFLTGAITSSNFATKDFRSGLPRFKGEAFDANLAIVERVRAVADRLEVKPGQVALAWTLAQGDNVIPIPGTKRIAYLEENAAAAEIALSEDDLAELNELPAAVGDRY